MVNDLSHTTKLSIAHVNLNSLSNKVTHVANLLSNNSIDFLAMSETWLTNSSMNSILDIHNYEIVRSDSPSQRRKHGMAVYIRNCIKFTVVSCNVDNMLIIHLIEFNVYVVNVYRPPSYTSEENLNLISLLNNFCINKEVIVQGDFNLPTLKWCSDPTLFYISPNDLLFYEMFILLGLHQVVSEPTYFPSCNTLDLFFTNDIDRVGQCTVLPPLPGCLHSPVKVEYIFQSFLPVNDAINCEDIVDERLWSRGRYDLLARCLNDVDWDTELTTLLPSDQYTKLIAILTPLVDRFIPKKSPNSSTPWPKNPPNVIVRAKRDAWRMYKDCRMAHGRYHTITLTAFAEFKRRNDEVKRYAIDSQKKYELKLSTQIDTNPKLFHAYIKHKKVGKPVVGPLRISNDSLTDDPSAMANIFVTSFASVFSIDSPNNPCDNQICENTIDDLSVSPEQVRDTLASLNPNSSMGEDGMHPRLLKALANELCVPLSILFKTSLETGLLPEQWLSSMVVPIFKKNTRYDPLNYRPVSLTSSACKVFERILVKHLTDYLDINSIISEEQFGFRASHSTVDQLILTYNDITRMLDDGRIVDLVFFDFTKAFDLVNHHILFAKLRSLGITGNILNWICSFLTNRSMKVRVAGILSDSVPVTSGVPQGTAVGPLLFLIYVNYITAGLSCSFKVFADDLKNYLSFPRSTSETLPVHLLQTNIDSGDD